MPNIKSAVKALRQMKKRALRNKKVTTGVSIAIKQARTLLNTKDKSAITKVMTAIKALDKAAQKGIIKANTASRKKSRLMRAFNKIKSS